MFDNEEVGMKITLDRGSCSCCDPACEALFGWHFLGKEITPADRFLIHSKRRAEKVLVVDETNWGWATDSWVRAWELQV